MGSWRRALPTLGVAGVLVGACGLDRQGISASTSAGASTGAGASSSASSATASSGPTGPGGGGQGGGVAGAGGAGGAGGRGGQGGAGGIGGAMPVCGDGTLDPGEQCDDGAAVDGDGCSASCTFDASDGCAVETTIALGSTPVVVTGDTTGAGKDWVAGCAPLSGASGDVVVAVTPAGAGFMNVDLAAGFDNKVVSAALACPAAGEIDCQYQADSDDAHIGFAVQGGQTYYVFVDGWGGAEGTFTLTLSLQVCGDGVLQAPEECDDGGTSSGDGCDASCTVACSDIGGVEDPSTHHCYALFEGASDLGTWDQAALACTASGPGWYLASLTSASEVDFVDTNGGLNPGSDVSIGGSDTAVEGTFVWTNGEPWWDGGWGSGEPNDANSNEDCVELDERSAMVDELNDAECATVQGHLCEWTPPGAP